MGYNPGLVSAIVVFLPLSAWAGYACFGKDRLSYRVMALLIFDGMLLHAMLIGSTFAFINGIISGMVLDRHLLPLRRARSLPMLNPEAPQY